MVKSCSLPYTSLHLGWDWQVPLAMKFSELEHLDFA